MLRVIATDLDGTFLADHRSVSETNQRAVQAAHDAGIHVVIATGRAVRWIDFLRPLAADDAFAITSNGAGIVDMATWEYARTFELDLGLAHDVVADLRKAFPDVAFATESGHEVYMEADYFSPYHDQVETLPFEEACERGPLLKVVAQRKGMPSPEFLAAAAPVIGDRLTGTYSWVGDIGHIEISAPGISKAHALESLCADFGVEASDVAAFGDMPNDLEMLRWVGQPHVMPKAHPLLLETGFPVLAEPSADAVGKRILELLRN